MDQPTVYFISGLGADRTVFDQLDLSFCKPVFLDWIPPLRNESLRAYALRLAAGITEPDATVIGLSMGGMMASEMLRAGFAQRAIIISSIRTARQLPGYMRFVMKYMPAYRLTTRTTLRMVFPFSCWFLGAKTSDDKKHLWQIMQRTDLSFVKWCIGAISKWDLQHPQQQVVHLHGTADRLLPIGFTLPDYRIEGGGHLMVRNKAAQISSLLRELITK